MWDSDKGSPFEIHNLSKFSETDIPVAWIHKKLSDKRRLMKKKISCLPSDADYSIFCKVELGKHNSIKNRLFKSLISLYN